MTTAKAITDEPMDLISNVPQDVAEQIVTSVQNYYGMLNIRVACHIGAPRPSVEVWSTGWTLANFHKAQQFAVGVSWGITSARGY